MEAIAWWYPVWGLVSPANAQRRESVRSDILGRVQRSTVKAHTTISSHTPPCHRIITLFRQIFVCIGGSLRPGIQL